MRLSPAREGKNEKGATNRFVLGYEAKAAPRNDVSRMRAILFNETMARNVL
jgi:hypothetical protein